MSFAAGVHIKSHALTGVGFYERMVFDRARRSMNKADTAQVDWVTIILMAWENSSRLRTYSINTTDHTACPQQHRAVLVEKPSVSLCRFCASVVSSEVFQHPAEGTHENV